MDKKMIAGVCAGIADYLQADVTVIRLLWLLIVIFTGFAPGALAYLLAALVMPVEDKVVVSTPTDAQAGSDTSV
jgi:phage shock protein C